MYCTSCGKQIPDDVRFCTACGAPVGQSPQAPQTEPLQPAQSPTSQAQPSSPVPPLQQTQQMPLQSPYGAPVQPGQLAQPIQSVQPGQPVQPPQSSYGTSVQQPSAPSAGGPNKGVIIGIVAGAVVIVVAIIVAVLVFGQPQQPQQAPDANSAATSTDESADAKADQSQSAEPAPSATPEPEASDSAPAASAAAPTTYQNARYGFSIQIPGDFSQTSAGDNGAGVIFSQNSNPDVIINAYGSNNINNETAVTALAAEVDRVRINGYTATGDNWFVYSYEDAGKIVYMKQFVGEGSMATMYIEYPASMSDEGAQVVEAVMPTFAPGDLSDGH